MAKKRAIRSIGASVKDLRRAMALATATALAVGALAVTTPVPASAAPLSIESAKVLDLAFDGDLTDTGPNAAAVTMQKGTASYGTGVDGQAFQLNGSNAIRLGTAAYLQPADLTVSFWYKPNATMTGEQVFAWSKLAYNSPGWYLTSESDSSPLVLSVGPASGQPY
jgi:hypothetical protein